MGWWSTGIMGGDTPLDIECSFEEKFGKSGDVKPEQAIELIDEISSKWGQHSIVAQVVGFLMIRRCCEFNDELRKIVLDGIDDDDPTDWIDVNERQQSIDEFRDIVVRYTNGEKVNLPHQPGVFERLMKDLNQ